MVKKTVIPCFGLRPVRSGAHSEPQAEEPAEWGHSDFTKHGESLSDLPSGKLT